MKTKVILIQGLLAPYRFPVFAKLAENFDFEVWFMGKEVKNRIWGLENIKNYSFKHQFLSGITLNFGSKDNYPFWINLATPFKLMKEKADVVIIFGWDSLTSFLISLFRFLYKDTKIIIYSDSTINERSIRRSITLPIVKLYLKNSDYYIAGGTRAKEYFIKLGVNPEKISIAFNVNDVEKYKELNTKFRKVSDNIKKEIGFLGKKIIMFYGQLIERKGVDILLHAFKKIKEVHQDFALLIVGSGIFKQSLNEIIEKENIKDSVILEDPGDDVVCKYYAISDIFVLPSREEVWGLVVNEAMACGLPIIVSDIAGVSEDLVKNGVNGFVFKSGNIDSLYEKLEILVLSAETRARFGKNSTSVIKSFNPEASTKGFVEAIESVTTSKNI